MPIGRRVLGFARLIHPFPTVLVALATGALTGIAGGDGPAIAQTTVAMLCIQAGIGSLNDIVDREADRDRPGKPIPAGRISLRAARVVVVLAFALGIGLAFAAGPAVGAVAILGAGLGIAYDLRLARTAWSWLPLAAAIPLVPAVAWLAATGTLPTSLLALGPAAVLAGAGLALANDAAGHAEDVGRGAGSIATRLGRGAAQWVASALLTAAALLAAPVGARAAPSEVWAAWVAGLVLVVLGAVAARLVTGSPGRRRAGWAVQAVGIAVIGLGALGSLASAGV